MDEATTDGAAAVRQPVAPLVAVGRACPGAHLLAAATDALSASTRRRLACSTVCEKLREMANGGEITAIPKQLTARREGGAPLTTAQHSAQHGTLHRCAQLAAMRTTHHLRRRCRSATRNRGIRLAEVGPGMGGAVGVEMWAGGEPNEGAPMYV